MTFPPKWWRRSSPCEWYLDAVKDFIPTKQRELPEWAKNISRDGMIAAGNVGTEEEAVAICKLAVDNLRVWFQSVPSMLVNRL